MGVSIRLYGSELVNVPKDVILFCTGLDLVYCFFEYVLITIYTI